MIKDFQLFLHTVDEYKRFANHLPVKNADSLTDDYSEADYIGIQVRLMLLRKFYAQSKQEKVYIKNMSLSYMSIDKQKIYNFKYKYA